MKFRSILYNIKKSEIMATNINRDYLITLNVKSGAITAPSMYFFNTDKSTNNIYI